jgi:chorismate lyase / 3-hydroxybenzoate synthase
MVQKIDVYSTQANTAWPDGNKAPYLMGQVLFGVPGTIPGSAQVFQYVHAQLLHATAGAGHEAWMSDTAGKILTEPGLACWYSTNLVFGVIEVQEEVFSGQGARALELAATHTYEKLFALAGRFNCPNVWRVWNYLPNINVQTHGLERYRQFNAGRQHGFVRSARHVTGSVPAACALGTRSGPLSVAFIAGSTPATPIENPRQISAYHYPEQYGAKTPTFSRATLATLAQQELFFLSGTASIVGHETVHHGNTQLQIVETLANIQAVLDQANQHTHAAKPYALHDLLMRVYVRHAHEVEVIRRTLDQQIGADHRAVYLHADICRHDLDVEIEAVAWKSLRNNT